MNAAFFYTPPCGGYGISRLTIDGVRIVCLANNISPIDIYTPSVLLERGASNGC